MTSNRNVTDAFVQLEREIDAELSSLGTGAEYRLAPDAMARLQARVRSENAALPRRSPRGRWRPTAVACVAAAALLVMWLPRGALESGSSAVGISVAEADAFVAEWLEEGDALDFRVGVDLVQLDPNDAGLDSAWEEFREWEASFARTLGS